MLACSAKRRDADNAVCFTCTQYTYLSIGCSNAQRDNMLRFARAQIGKPFSNFAMARALFFPRTTTLTSFYCAELVAAVLKQGGLISSDSNPGAATPHSLYKLFNKQAAATANPYMLRQVGGSLNFNSIVSSHPAVSGVVGQQRQQQRELQALLSTAKLQTPSASSRATRDTSPPRASFRLLNASGAGGGIGRVSADGGASGATGIKLSLTSLRG